MNQRMPCPQSGSRLDRALAAFLWARHRVIESGFEAEILWQESRSFERVREPDLLREAGWCILSAGISEAAVRSCFGGVSRAFRSWSSATQIACEVETCIEEAIQIFSHERKVASIGAFCVAVAEVGLPAFREQLRNEREVLLQTLPGFGPAVARHLLQNLGVGVAKPDRHLRRIAERLEFPSPQVLCETIASELDDRVDVVDLVFWRMATIDRTLAWLDG